MTTTPEPLKIFVSHATADDDIVTRIHDTLEAETGADIWVDHKDIGPGDIWELEIEANLRTRPYFMVCISKNSMPSLEVRAEWREAIALGHNLLPVVIDDIQMSAIPPRLKLYQLVWVSETSLNKDVEKLVHAIRKASGLAEADDEPSFTIISKITGEIPRNLVRITMHGRENDLKAIQDALITGNITAIIGVGGLGKSRLAAEVVANSEAKGIVWHRISDISRTDDVVVMLRQNMGLPDNSEREEIITKFGTETRLLVLDNGEDATGERLDDYVILANELCSAGAKVLLTSRVMWDDLEMPRENHPQTLPLDTAVQVVAEMAIAYDVSVPETEHQAIARDGRQHPWLIEWAIKQMKRLPIQHVLALLQSLDVPRIQDAIYQMIGKTVEQMREESAEAAKLLTWITVFRGGFTYDAAKFVTRDSGVTDFDTALEILQKYAFVNFDQSTQRYKTDVFVIEVIPTNLEAHKPHYFFYFSQAEEHNSKQDYVGLNEEQENLQSAFEWALSVGDGEDALWLMNRCGQYMTNRGYFELSLNWAIRVLERLDSTGKSELRASALNAFGNRYAQLPHGNKVTNIHKAIDAFEEVLTIRGSDMKTSDYAGTQSNIGLAYTELSLYENPQLNLEKAISAYKVALKNFAVNSDQLAYAMVQNNLGMAYRRLSKYKQSKINLDSAIQAYQQSLQIYTPESSPIDYAMAQNNLGTAFRELSEYAQSEINLNLSIEALKTSLSFANIETAPQDYAATQNNLGNTYRTLAHITDPKENLGKAIDAYKEALRIRTIGTDPVAFSATKHNLGTAFSDLADYEQPIVNLNRAIHCYKKALQIRTAEDYPLDYALTRNSLGVAYWKLSPYENSKDNQQKAINSFQEALRFYTVDSTPLDYAQIKANMGVILERQQQIDEALLAWREAEAIYLQLGHPHADRVKGWIEEYENPGD